MNEIKYLYKSKKSPSSIIKYHFKISNRKKDLYFYTYKDLSGFKLQYSVSNPKDFIILGVEIITNMDYIKNKVQELRKVKKWKKQKKQKKKLKKFMC